MAKKVAPQKIMANSSSSEVMEMDVNLERELLSWEAPERTFQERDKDFWITAISMLVLVSVILIFIKEFFLVMALFSALFLYYVLASVRPGSVKCKLTTRGIYFGEARYEWPTLSRFWFQKTLSYETVTIETKLNFPKQIVMVITGDNKQKIKEIMLKRIPLLESSPSTIDKLTVFVRSKLPLESRKK